MQVLPGMHCRPMAIAEALSEVMNDKIENIYYENQNNPALHKADLFLKRLKAEAHNIAREYGCCFM